MIKAKMIVDFDNAVSMKYMELSLESFKPLYDILSIEPVQCTTPKTLPIRFEIGEQTPSYLQEGERTYPRFFGGDFEDTPGYQAIMHSHFKLWQEIENEGPFIIMEHDAALIDEKVLRRHLERWLEYDVFMPGACMEFYSLSPRLCELACDFLLNFPNFKRLSGPYGILWELYNHRHKGFDDSLVLLPTKCREDIDMSSESRRIGKEDAMTSAANGNGTNFPVAVKQYFFMLRKNTSPHRYSMDTYSCKDNPNAYPWRRDFVLIDDLGFDELQLPEELE